MFCVLCKLILSPVCVVENAHAHTVVHLYLTLLEVIRGYYGFCVGILIGYCNYMFPFPVGQRHPLLCSCALCCIQYFSVVRRPCASLLVIFPCLLLLSCYVSVSLCLLVSIPETLPQLVAC